MGGDELGVEGGDGTLEEVLPHQLPAEMGGMLNDTLCFETFRPYHCL